MSTTLFLTLALTPWAAGPQDAPVRTEAPAPAARPARADLPAPVLEVMNTPAGPARDRVWYDAPGDGSIWARGATYKASFDSEAATYYPALGPEAPSNYPVRFELREVASGAELLPLGRSSAPVRDGDRVSIDRGSLTELYALEPTNMEQMFVFEGPLPARDLALRIDVVSELAFGFATDGFEFAGELGRVGYGEAVVLDAGGRRSPAATTWTGDGIEILVPGSFLEGATYPVTVDPIVSTFIVDDFTEGLLWPDVAYDVSTDSYVFVYEEMFSASDIDVFFRQYDAAGGYIRGGYVNATVLKWIRPKVANNNDADQFLIACEQESGSFSQVVIRTLDATDGALGIVRGIDGTEFVSQEDPDVGGDFYPGSPSFYYVVWTEDSQAGRKDIRGRLVDTTGLPLGTFSEYLTFDSTTDERPAISKSAGSTPSSTSVWTAVWERDGGGQRDIWGAQIAWNGTITHSAFPISTAGIDDAEPSVSSILDGDTGERAYMVVSHRDFGTDRDIQAHVLEGTTLVTTADLSVLESEDLFDDQTLPSVDSDGERFVLAFSEFQPGSSWNNEIYMSTYHLSSGALCVSESRVQVTSSTSDDALVEVACEYSGNGARRRSMATWSSGSSVFDANVLAVLYDAATPDCIGVNYCGPAALNSSGQSARIRAFGSDVAGGNPLSLVADRMPANKFGYFLAGRNTGFFMPPGSQGFICLSGAIARFNGPGQIRNSGAAGTFELDINTLSIPTTPSQPVLSGQTWRFQAWFRDNDPGVTSNFTDGVEIAFQ